MYVTGAMSIVAPLRGAPRADIEPDPAQEERLLHDAGTDFAIKRTPHFLIAFNARPDLVDSLILRLERTYDAVYRFCEGSGFDVKPLDRRLEVVLLDTWADYEAFGRRNRFNYRGTYGFYSDVTNRSAFFNVENDPQLLELSAGIVAARNHLRELETRVKNLGGNERVEIRYPDGRRERLSRAQAVEQFTKGQEQLKSLNIHQEKFTDRINRTVIQHEAAHQVLYNLGVHVRGAQSPRWLVEGLACIFETPPTPTGAGIATVNQARLRDFRTIIADESPRRSITSGDYIEAVSEGRMTSLRDLVGKPDLFDERGSRGTTHYAATWALVHYLHRAMSPQLAAYLRELAGRRPGQVFSPDAEIALFEKHFGAPDEAFARKFANHILALPVRATSEDLN